jgi:hypothetical protein
MKSRLTVSVWLFLLLRACLADQSLSLARKGRFALGRPNGRPSPSAAHR